MGNVGELSQRWQLTVSGRAASARALNHLYHSARSTRPPHPSRSKQKTCLFPKTCPFHWMVPPVLLYEAPNLGVIFKFSSPSFSLSMDLSRCIPNPSLFALLLWPGETPIGSHQDHSLTSLRGALRRFLPLASHLHTTPWGSSSMGKGYTLRAVLALAYKGPCMLLSLV